MIYITSDLHFGHSNIIKYCKRPFANVDEMDTKLIDNWNNKIQKNDEVFVVGDFSFQNPIKYLPLLNGKKYLINGNHDDVQQHTLTNHWVWVRNYYELKVNVDGKSQMIVLNHYAMRTWNKQHHGSWSLFGHSHGSLEPYGKSFDIGVDCWNYFPVSINEIAEKMKSLNDIVVKYSD